MASIEISILLPAYNAAKYISETIDSLLNQSFRDFELLIADDGSSDHTREIIDSYKDERIKTFHNGVNQGKPKTIAKLYDQAQGSLITMHDADDLSHPDRLQKMHEFMRANPHISMAGHKIQRISEEGKLLPLYRFKSPDFEEIKRQMEFRNTDGDPSIFIRREIIADIGGLFRPYFQNNMDYDLALRIIEKYETSNLDETLSYYRNVPGSISKGIDSYKKLTTQKITQYLHQERIEGKQDALQRGDNNLIKELEEKFAQPYLEDKTLYLRETAAFFLYSMMYKEAIAYSWKAVKMEPMRLVNIRTLQHCIRKTYLKF